MWWAPRRPDWWVALLFAVGSICFALGATPMYASAVGIQADDVTYFVGSLFFTSAAFLQLLLSCGVVPVMTRPLAGVRWRTLVRAPHRPEWWASIVQFSGTLLFNVSTFAAMHQALTTTQQERRIWAPDALGSIAFLVASALAYADVERPWVTWRPRDLNWSVATLNMVGSLAFGASAIAAYVVPTTGDLRNAQVANAGTWIGAVCFFLGAVLLVPDQAESAGPVSDPDRGRTVASPGQRDDG